MKKLISVVIAVLMLAAFSACGDKNSETSSSPTDVSPGDIEILDPTPTPEPQPVSELSICGIPIVTNGQPTGIGYQGVEYADGVLTLDGLDIVADYGSVNAIYFLGDLEIVVNGENTVTTENGKTAILGELAEDESTSNLVISGDGSLTVSADDAYGLVCSGSVNVTCGALDITGTQGAVGLIDGELILGDGLSEIENTDTHISIGPAA